MTDPSTSPTPSDVGDTGKVSGLGEVRTGLSPEEIVLRLEAAARRGKMAGFAVGDDLPGGGLFEITDFGTPFESRLVARAEPAAGGGTMLRFEVRMKPLMPWVFAVLLGVSVWPGVWLTDSMLKTYFDWYTIETWWWYIPLTLPFCPWAMRSAVRKSRATAMVEGAEMVEKVRGEVGG